MVTKSQTSFAFTPKQTKGEREEKSKKRSRYLHVGHFNKRTLFVVSLVPFLRISFLNIVLFSSLWNGQH